jgi:GxxExxY protein
MQMDMFEFKAGAESGVDAHTEALAREVIGAAIEVHRALGPGMPENVYRLALSHELDLRGIRHVKEAPMSIEYKGKQVGEGRMDILVEDRLILELKTVDALHDVHRSQLLAYLQATKLRLGLLINFNVAVLKTGIKRIINTRGK